MIIEQLVKDIEDRMKYELLIALQWINRVVKIEKLLQLEIEILWSRKESRLQKLLIT